MPERVQEAMQMQVEAERKKRAAILESEGMHSALKLEKNAISKVQKIIICIFKNCKKSIFAPEKV